MLSTELHGERRCLNLHLVGRVVRFRRIFLEVWIFRNVWHKFQNLVAHRFAAPAAIRKDGVAHQDHAGARLVPMAYFVDPRLINQLSRNQCAIGLVVYCDVSVLQFHNGACFSFLPGVPGSAGWGAAWPSKLGCVQGSYKLVRSCFEERRIQFFFRQPGAFIWKRCGI